MSEFGPAQVSLGLFFDHSGQDIFEEGFPSVINSTGLSVDYAPWSFIQLGIFGGAAEFDNALPDALQSDSSKHSYNSDYQMMGGASGKLATPRFAANTTRAVAFGALTFINSTDGLGNGRQGFIYNAGATMQFMLWDKLNLALGGEFYAIDGTQKTALGDTGPFGINAPDGIVDYFRGIVGLEYYFSGRNRPFISIAFRPTGSLGWHDQLGLRGASISVTLGAMASVGKRMLEPGEEDPGMIDK